jgi:hypothetical protein
LDSTSFQQQLYSSGFCLFCNTTQLQSSFFTGSQIKQYVCSVTLVSREQTLYKNPERMCFFYDLLDRTTTERNLQLDRDSPSFECSLYNSAFAETKHQDTNAFFLFKKSFHRIHLGFCNRMFTLG